jgi:cytochrome c553
VLNQKRSIHYQKGNEMKAKMGLWAILMSVAFNIAGCGSPHNGTTTGFLSDYSRLTKWSESTIRYLDKNALADYRAFVVDPVQVRLRSDSESNLTDQQIADLAAYMHDAIVESVKTADKEIASLPGEHVARIRTALTDLRQSEIVSLVPQASLLGVGIGGASMEAEIVDSVSGRQIGAIVESAKGSRIPFANMGNWDAAKGAMDMWAKRLQYCCSR